MSSAAVRNGAKRSSISLVNFYGGTAALLFGMAKHHLADEGNGSVDDGRRYKHTYVTLRARQYNGHPSAKISRWPSVHVDPCHHCEAFVGNQSTSEAVVFGQTVVGRRTATPRATHEPVGAHPAKTTPPSHGARHNASNSLRSRPLRSCNPQNCVRESARGLM